MTVRVWRWLIFTAVVAPCFGVATGAPPAPDRKSGVEDPSVERARLQAKLLKMLETMTVGPAPTYPPAPAPGSGSKKTETGSGSGGKSIDPIREATNYFRDNDFEGARRTFQLIDPATLGPEDRAFVRYMLACSCRRLGRIADAEGFYREVANNPTDEFLSNCAIWQLSLIKADQELQAQLEQLRSRTKTK